MKIENIKIPLLAILLTMIVCSCSNEKKSTVADDFENQKEELIEAYGKLETSLDDAIDSIEDKMNINEGPVERSLEEAKEDLIDKKNALQKSLSKAKRANKDNWASVKKEAEGVFESIDSGFKKLKSSIEDKVENIKQ